MNNQFVTKESLLYIGIGGVSAGIALMPTKLLEGIMITVAGFLALFIRSYLKLE